MSQLDISISFSHLIGFLLCFYFFIHYVMVVVIQYWYNEKLRNLSQDELTKESTKIDHSILIKRILKS